MDDSARRYAHLLVGLLLVTSPLYAPALDVTSYEYERTRLVADDGNLRIEDGSELPPSHGIEGIDCLFERRISRLCVHEAGLTNGTRRADHPRVLDVIGSPHLRADTEYVAFTDDAPVYERTVYWQNGSYVLGLVQVPAERVLDDVATDSEYVSPQVRAAIEAGSVQTDDQLADANRVVETSDGYFFVHETGHSSLLETNPQEERLLEWVAVLLGVVLVRSA